MSVFQSNILSLVLSNIYLHELDVFMTELTKKYHKGDHPTPNEAYYKKLKLNKYEKTLTNEIQNKIKWSKRRNFFNKGVKLYFHNSNYIRI